MRAVVYRRMVLLAILGVFIIYIFSSSLAEDSFFSVVENTLNEIIECSDKQFIHLSAQNADTQCCSLDIDFTEGNYSIVAVEGDDAILVYPFESEELAGCIVELLICFDDIEGQLPEDKYLKYDLRVSEKETYTITKETLMDFIALLIGSGESVSEPTYNSTIPFENLEFSDFLYEEFSNGNAKISGVVKNNNDYTVDGYFHILFYKNNKLVHTELVALPTIPAGGTGVWSDLIYNLDYGRIEYADSNVIRR